MNIFFTLLIGAAITIIVFLGMALIDNIEFRANCNNHNGIVIFSNSERYCIDSKFVKDYEV